MIDAIFFIYNDSYNSFEIKGHAKYNSYGYDIVCSAVSSAVEMTIDSIKNIINANCNIDIDNESATIKLQLQDKNNYIASLYIKSLYNHLLNISSSYPNNLKVNLQSMKN